jgi:hypothetical protein
VRLTRRAGEHPSDPSAIQEAIPNQICLPKTRGEDWSMTEGLAQDATPASPSSSNDYDSQCKDEHASSQKDDALSIPPVFVPSQGSDRGHDVGNMGHDAGSSRGASQQARVVGTDKTKVRNFTWNSSPCVNLAHLDYRQVQGIRHRGMPEGGSSVWDK